MTALDDTTRVPWGRPPRREEPLIGVALQAAHPSRIE